MSFHDNFTVPLVVSNQCQETLWPGIGTQHGRGPGTGGFELESGNSREFNVSWDWQGRVWGRTNCTFNSEGTGPESGGSIAGPGTACSTGDCFGKLNCEFTGGVPATLAEFTLSGGVGGKQTFYDISLVDGYNLPLAIVYIPAPNTTYIPPNLVNPSCIATTRWLAPPARTGTEYYTNSTYPMPYEPNEDNNSIDRWCPWDLQRFPPEKPSNGVYPYPDDYIERPLFNPCLSACSKTGSKEDCCSGDHADPNVCKSGLYSANAKRVCPDAYSYAFDDQTSTFIIPSGGGWEVVFCPKGRSTNILQTFGTELASISYGGNLSRKDLDNVRSEDYIKSRPTGASSSPTLSLKKVLALSIGLGLLTVV